MALIALVRRLLGEGRSRRSRHRRARRPRRVPVLRGQPHHPRDLGAVRRRGSAGRRSAAGAPRPPDRLCDPRRAVRGAALRHGARRGSVRTDHDRLVLRARPRRHRGHREASAGDPGALADLGRRLRGCARLHRVRRDRGRRPLHHRRRGALRRHGAFRQAGDRAGLVPLRLPGAHPELPGPGGSDPHPARRRGEPVLPADPGMGAAAHGRPRHHGDGDRLTSRDLGRLLGQPAGHAAGLPAGAAGEADQRARRWAGVPPGGQRRAVHRRSRARARLRDVGATGHCVRCRRHGGAAHRHRAHARGGEAPVALAAVEAHAGRGGLRRRGARLPLRQPRQDRPRRVAAPARRHDRVRGDDDVAAGAQDRHRQPAAARGIAAGVRRRAARAPGATGARHGRLPAPDQGHRAAGPAGEPAAQPRPARPGGDRVGAGGERAVRGPRPTGCTSTTSATTTTASTT